MRPVPMMVRAADAGFYSQGFSAEDMRTGSRHEIDADDVVGEIEIRQGEDDGLVHNHEWAMSGK